MLLKSTLDYRFLRHNLFRMLKFLKRYSLGVVLFLFAGITCSCCSNNFVSDPSCGIKIIATPSLSKRYPIVNYPPSVWKKSHKSLHPFVRFLCKNNAKLSPEYAEKIVEIYYKEAQIENINVLVAIAQMAHETAYLKFNGTVDAKQYNFAGIGTLDTATPGNLFPNETIGVRAHIQHLKSYASDEALKTQNVDPRRHLLLGKPKAHTIHDLTRRWATDPDYGRKIEKFIQRIAQECDASM